MNDGDKYKVLEYGYVMWNMKKVVNIKDGWMSQTMWQQQEV